MVGTHTGGNHDRIQIGAIEQVAVLGFARDFRVKGLEVLQPRRVEITHQLELAIRQGPEVPD
jgi:hypothetical protein